MKYDGKKIGSSVEYIIKGYKYHQLRELQEAKFSLSFFRSLSNTVPGIVNYSQIFLQEDYVILIRKKLERNLVDFSFFQQPPLEDSEKMFIFYQLAKILQQFHNSSFFHGDLKPNNIFINRNLETFITDPAPFKPTKIDPKMRHFFYHFFTTNDTGCCLAPERIDEDNESKVDLKISDMFSLGCSVAYLYLNGKHLFSLDDLINYKNGEYDIEASLSKITDETVKSLLYKLLEIDPSKRITDNELIEHFDSFYEAARLLLSKQSKDNSESIMNELRALLLLAKSNTIIIVFVLISDILLQTKNFNTIIMGLNFVSEISSRMTDSLKLTRVIPLLMYFTQFESPIVLHSALFGIIDVLKTVDEVPEDLSNFFDDYLEVEFSSLWSEFTGQDKVVFAKFIPPFVLLIKKLFPKSRKDIIHAFSQILTINNFEIFQSLSRSLRSIAKDSDFSILSSFYFIILSNVNLPDERFKIEILKIVSTFYKYAKRSQRQKYSDFFQEKILLCLHDMVTYNPSNQLLINIFSLLDSMIKQKMISIDIIYGFFGTIQNQMIGNNLLLYYMKKLIDNSPKEIQDSFLQQLLFAPQNSERTPKQHKKVFKSNFLFTNSNKPIYPRKSIENPNPKFLTSFRCNEVVPIKHIFGSAHGTQCIIVGANNRIRWINLLNPIDQQLQQPSQQSSHITRNNITAAQPLSATHFVLGFDNGAIEAFEFQTRRKMIVEQPRNEILTQIRQIHESVLLCSHKSGLLSLYDLRDKGSNASFRFKSNGISDICTWPGNSYLAGVGFKEGLVSLVDLRMFTPFWILETPSVDMVIPAYSDSGCSLFVQNRQRIEMIREPLTKAVLTYDGPSNFVLSYKGGALVIDDKSVSYLSPLDKMPCFHFSDLGNTMILDSEKTNLERIVHPFNYDTSIRSKYPSLHQHSGNVTCAAQCGGVFVSGDDLGVMNVWQINGK
ncbi:phosphoinositide 3-kinase regulatory subunit 4-like [Histomonas meleagridis]|uniref:phosphoinositide 3-kinase regulatory subunit 4-like n=1 Tax=Histomonas meleagridis TaxID=135588 RepID=UPI00355A89AC|nr:phosphoinositide 3-kinase regulatory subunit 4-like [Histomonas meleagridis]KAH0797381.1 phosphoinositide 3-kinase regulatory subunit 4-like [Histomonas meleagridis]